MLNLYEDYLYLFIKKSLFDHKGRYSAEFKIELRKDSDWYRNVIQ